MSLHEALDRLRDPYERKARVFPGLLVALPLLVPLLWIFGPRNPLLTALLGLLGGCGVIYALASISRGLGKRLEERLVVRWGGMPTTLLLRHRDTFLDSRSKARYHDEIRKKLGLVLPTPEEEIADPAAADELYIGATRELRELMRGKAHSLLLKENIAYGFHRNMCALRPVGWLTSLLGIFFGLLLAEAIVTRPYGTEITKLLEPGLPGGITLAMGSALFFAWMYFTPGAVKRMGYVYAERLFESMKALPTKRNLRVGQS